MISTRTATKKEMMNTETLLTNKKGDQLWRFVDSFDGRPQFKVFAIEPKMRTQIKNWEDSKAGADYFINGKYFATDFIIPKKYLNRTAKLLGFDLRNNPKRIFSEAQKANQARMAERMRNSRQTRLFANDAV